LQEIKITANGLELRVPSGITVTELLGIMKEPVRHDLIVEINRKFIHLKEYGAITVNEGDCVEVIGLDFGG
jgi:thiamine biosynthesis protein ThiS